MALSHLNEDQRKVVLHPLTTIMCYAGPGSGKTRTLVERVNFLLENQTPPNEILALTFTKKAAKEMQERAKKRSKKAEDCKFCTFHSLCNSILRESGHLIGIKKFTIADTKKCRQIIKECKNIAEEDTKTELILSIISKAKNAQESPADFKLNLGNHKPLNDIIIEEKIHAVYEIYERQLRSQNLVDFDDLLLLSYKLLKIKQVQQYYHQTYKHILIDEYQDTNALQFLITKLLAYGNRSLLVVGDPNQSIYAFRGAERASITRFRESFPEASELCLRRNYRSTKNIINAANSVLKGLKRKTAIDSAGMYTENEVGEKVHLEKCKSDKDEANFVIEQLSILKNKSQNFQLANCAVLFRSRRDSYVLEQKLLRSRIPVRMTERNSLFDRLEISILLDYLRVIEDKENDHSMKQILNVPKRGLGKQTLQKLDEFRLNTGLHLFEIVERLVNSKHRELQILDPNSGTTFGKAKYYKIEIGNKSKHELKEFIQLIKELQCMKENLKDLIDLLLRRIDYLNYVKKQKNGDEIIKQIQLFQKLTDFEEDDEEAPEELNLETFLEQCSFGGQKEQQSKESGNRNALTLSTIHASKGLEWKNVFLIGCAEGMLPHLKCRSDPNEMDEERRLCYVAMTRAKKRLFLSYPKFVFARELKQYERSQFFERLPGKNVEVHSYATKENGKKKRVRRQNAFVKRRKRKRKRGNFNKSSGFQKASALFVPARKAKPPKRRRVGLGKPKKKNCQSDKKTLLNFFKRKEK